MYLAKLYSVGSLTIRSTTLLNKNCCGIGNLKKINLAICQRYKSESSSHDLGINVYTAPLSTRIRTVKRFSLATSVCGLMTQPIIIQKVLEEGLTVTTAISGFILQTFTFVTPFLLHFVTKKYVREIYFNPEKDEYTAMTYSILATDKLLTFNVDNVIAPDLPGMFTSIIVKGTPLFIDASYFHDIDHYKRIMGFDKPIDFKLGDQTPKS